MLHSKLFFRDL